MAAEVGEQGVEEVPVALAEVAGADQVDRLLGDRVVFQPGQGVIAVAVDLGELVGGVAEEEEVVPAHPLADLDVGAIEGADREGAIEGHLHVAGAGGLHAGGGDLLGEVHRRIDALAQLHAEVGEEHHPQPAMHGRIDVHDAGDSHNQADDQLGHVVARGRLAAEDHRAGRQVFAVAEAQVALHDLQGGQVLTLVFMDPLYLHIEQGGGVHQHVGVVADRGGQALLALFPHLLPAPEEGAVMGEGFQALQLVEVAAPGGADAFIEQGGQAGVGHRQPAARCHAVGHVGEPVGPEGSEVVEHVLHQQLAVEFGHPVHLVAAHHRQVGHAHLALAPFLDQGEALQQLRLPRVADPHHAQEAGVDLVDDRELARQQLAEELQAPGLEGLGQQGVVRVADRRGGDAPGGVPVDPVFIDEKPHQLRHGDGGVGVVELHRELVVELGGGHALALEDAEHVLQGAGHKEDLLAESQPLALLHLVVGIEHLGEGFRLHLLQHGAGVVAGVEGGEIEGFRRLGTPEPQGVGGVNAAAEDRGVVGHADHGVAADLHRIAPFRPDHLPGVAAGQPGVGALLLAFRADLLTEDPEFVADAIANRGELQGGH